MQPFAIVGVSARLPQGAVDEAGLWEVLQSGTNLMTEWPHSRGNAAAFYDGSARYPNTLPARGAHFLREDPALFDAPFFSITAKEAASMDPQHRVALEAAYHAFENAGMPIEKLRGSRTAVYGATMTNDWTRMMVKDPDVLPRQAATGCSLALLANRVSWHMDLHGPSVAVDTACSSSLVAFDMACQAMQCGDATAALVIGTSLLLSPEISITLANMNFLSPDSRCYSFDSRANGYARGEGVIALVIRPLEDALRDGDIIRAVIRSTASNQDGWTPGLTKPNPTAQEALMRHAYAKAGLTLDQTSYVEAHGTGTPTGDPIEMTAIGKVFGNRPTSQPLIVGSIKSNVGHLEGASGLAGVVKSILMLERGLVPPQALFQNLNPDIAAMNLNVEIPTSLLQWPTPGLRRISVNSFGFGGANAHVVLDDAYHYLTAHRSNGFHHCVESAESALKAEVIPNGATQPVEGPHSHVGINVSGVTLNGNPKLLVWSAQDAGGAKRMLDNYHQYFIEHIADDRGRLNQLSYTLASRRSVMSWRSFAVIDEAASEPLKPSVPVRASADTTGMAFVFTGQGAQYAGMGLGLMEFPMYAKSMQKSREMFCQFGATWDLLDELENKTNINLPQFSQPLCTALQIALVDLLYDWGAIPSVVVGHSSGEIAAAYASGALTHEAACAIAYRRGEAAAQLKERCKDAPGAMLSANITPSEVPGYLEATGLTTAETEVHVACINSPFNVTLSGPANSIETMRLHLDSLGIFAKEVATGVAYHSPAMRAVAGDYLGLLDFLRYEERPQDVKHLVPMVSSVTGGIAAPKQLATPHYWVENLCSPVLFADAMARVEEMKTDSPVAGRVDQPLVTDVVEVGSHAALKKPIKDSASRLLYHSVMLRNKPQSTTAMELAGALFCRGLPISVAAANGQAGMKEPFLVDCPPYPFDHSRRYWDESRLSKGYRLREKTEGFLLGKRAQDWNPMKPRWRNSLNVETMPWLADHEVDGSVVMAGTGMLVMALEAANNTIKKDGSRQVSGFVIKNADFAAPIRIGKTVQQSTETEVNLQFRQTGPEMTSDWFDVQIYAHSEDSWTKCFTAEVQVEFDDLDQDTALMRERRSKMSGISALAASLTEYCTTKLDKTAFYKVHDENGLIYGEAFRLLDNIAWDKADGAVADVDVSSIDTENSNTPIHPAVLDAAVHLVLAQKSRGLDPSVPPPTVVPSKLRRAWISAKPWSQVTSTAHIASHVHTGDNEAKPTVDVTVQILSDSGSPLCTFDRLTMANVRRQSAPETTEEHRLLYSVAWEPLLGSLSGPALQQFLDANMIPQDKSESLMADYYPKIERAMRSAVRKAIANADRDKVHTVDAHLGKFCEAMAIEFAAEKYGNEENLDDDALELLLQECEGLYPEWRVFPAIARALPSILSGETNPLELMFATGAAETYYNSVYSNHMMDGRMAALIRAACHESPGLRILEVGAGTGGFTRHILQVLQDYESQTGVTAFSEYTFTDVSRSFFDAARSKFQAVADRLVFKVFDLESDPVLAGLDMGSYDIVIAGSVFHATSSLSDTLSGVRKLIKPSGMLIFQEITNPASASIGSAFGCLEGWWRSTELWRATTPLATVKQWNDVLLEQDFTGTEAILLDFKDDAHHTSSIVVTRPTKVKVNHDRSVVCLIVDGDERQSALATDMAAKTFTISQLSSRAWIPSHDDIVVCLASFQSQWLNTLSEDGFEALRSLVQSVNSMLWVGSPSSAGIDAFASVSTGLMRSIRSEYPDKHIVSLLLEPSEQDSAARWTRECLQICFLDSTCAEDVEFLVRDNKLVVGRLVEEKKLDEGRISRLRAQTTRVPWRSGPPVRLEIATPGMMETIRFIEDDEYEIPLGADEVEIEACAWPVSFRDVFIAVGRLPGERTGFECAGIVTRVGSEYTNQFAPGDRVVLGAFGSMRSHPRAKGFAVMKIPDGFDMNEAVAHVNPLMTAYQALVHVARLEKGEKVLIHSAAGSTGQMAVELANMIGAEVFVTVGSPDKKKLLMESFGVPETHIFHSRDTSFADGIARVTNGYGVDVVLNSLAGDRLRASWECIAPYGRFVEIGKADIIANASLPMARFARNVSYAAVDLLHIVETNDRLATKLASMAMSLITSGKIRGPRPLHLYPLSQTEKAYRYLQSGKNTGRIIITRQDDELVEKHITFKSSWKFDANATYVVVGGLGGLGRAILRWMASKGARNLIALSRSGPKASVASKLLEDLRNDGVNIIAPSCDVSSADALSTLLAGEAAMMPPIKGCINAAMVLQDSIFDNMTHAQWSLTLSSKVQSSWNLHSLLPADMDFFVLLSSLAGVYGTAAQSNYASGCTFQDELARKRTAASSSYPGLSLSLDLGWMADVGIISETLEYQKNRQNSRDMAPVHGHDLLAILDHYLDPAVTHSDRAQATGGQLLVGVVTPADCEANGQETPETLTRPLFGGFHPRTSAGDIGAEAGTSAHTKMTPDVLFRKAETLETKTAVVIETLKVKLARALDVAVDGIEEHKTLSDYGVDSLMAVELRNWIRKDFNAAVAVFDIMGNATITKVGNTVASRAEL